MDRRAALAKMAGTTALGAGAVLVQSSPAFADFGSVFCRPTDCTAPFGMNLALVGSVTRSDYVRATMSSPSFGCASGNSATVQYRYRISGGNGQPPRVTNDALVTLPTNGQGWTILTPTSIVRLLSGSSNTNLNNGSYLFEVIQRRMCSNGIRSCWCCVAQSRTFSMAGNDPIGDMVGPTPNSSGLCD